MDEDQPLQEAELADGVVGRHDGLPTFLAGDADADVGLLDHGHVVGAVADRQRHDVEAVLDQPHDGGLLARTDATAEDGLASLAEQQELLTELVAEHQAEGFAVDDERVRRRRRLVVLPRRRQLLVRAGDVELGQQLVQLGPGRLDRAVVDLEDDQLHLVRQQVAGEADVDGRLDLVARQDPELDAGVGEQRDRVGDAVLQPVLDGGPAQERELALDRVGHELELLVPVLDGGGGGVVFSVPALVLLLAQLPLRDAERPQALARKGLEVLGRLEPELGLLPGLQARVDDAVGALAEQDDPSVLGHADDGAHALPGRVELQRVQDLVVPVGAQGVDDHAVVGAADEGEAAVASGRHERRLVGRLRLELDLRRISRRDLGDDGVAQGQGEHEVLVRLGLDVGSGVSGRSGREVGDKVRGDEGQAVVVQVGVAVHLTDHAQHPVPIGRDLSLDLGRLLVDVDALPPLQTHLGLGVGLAVRQAVDGALLELHDVLGQGAGLVGEDVLDLTEVVRDAPRLGRARVVDAVVVHVRVAVDEENLGQLDQLDGDVQRDGHQVLEEDDAGPEGDEAVQRRGAGDGSELEEVDGAVLLGPGDALHDAAHEAHEEEDDEVVDDVPVQLARDAGPLARRDARVDHDLGLLAGEDDDAEHPLRVPEAAASQQQVLDRDGLGHVSGRPVRVLGLVLPPPHHGAVLVEVGVRRLALEDEGGPVAVASVLHLPTAVQRIAHLEVGLAVEVLRLDVARAVGIRGRQDDDVGRDLVVLVDADEVADLDVLPSVLGEAGLAGRGPGRIDETSVEARRRFLRRRRRGRGGRPVRHRRPCPAVHARWVLFERKGRLRPLRHLQRRRLVRIEMTRRFTADLGHRNGHHPSLRPRRGAVAGSGGGAVILILVLVAVFAGRVGRMDR